MFEFVRRHNRIMQFMLFLLIFPSFVMFGIDGYNRFRDKGNQVAEVDGHGITQDEWDNAHRQQIDRLRAQMPSIDVKMLDTPQAKYATLERLVQDKLIQAASTQLRIDVSDLRLARTLQQDPTIASLRKADGSLDVERYRQLAASQGLTPEGFEARLRQEIAQQQVVSGVADSSFLPDALANLTVAAYFEQREIQLARFNPVTSAFKPSTEDLKTYLEQNQARYQRPQSADIEYVVLDMARVEKDLVLPEADVRTYFEQNRPSAAAKEERRASHILINAPKDMPAPERDKARQKARQVLDLVKKNPKDFAKLAKQYSQDPGSAAQGGDLDYVSRGAMVKPFEDALFALPAAGISDLVETEFGYHIIALNDIRKPKTQTFEQARPEIERELRRQQAQRKFAEVAEQFSNLVYEQADSLKPVAERLKLTVQRVNGVTPLAQGKEPWAKPRVLAALFSAESIERKHNTEAIEVGPSQLVAARLVNYSPARALSLDEAREQIARDWAQHRAAEQAKQEGAAALKAWQEQPAQAKLGAPITVSRDQAGGLSPNLITAALRASADKLPAWVGVDLGDQGYAVLKVNKVLPAQKLEQRQSERAQMAQANANAQARAYLEHLKTKLDARILVAKPLGL